MDFRLKRPCKHCPFRKDVRGFLAPQRALEVAESVTVRNATFSCHNTLDYDVVDDDNEEPGRDSEQFCAGALIFIDKVSPNSNQLVRIAERLGLLDYKQMEGKEVVFDSVEEMVEHNEINRRN